MKKEFNLKKETEEWADKWIHRELTGRAYKELRDIEKEFIKKLKKDAELDGIDCAIVDKLAGDELI